MTEKEAIAVLKMIETHGPLPTKAKEMSIAALEEIQQYRAIGTVKEIKTQEESTRRLEEAYLMELATLREYREIGTLEECREAVEKMKPKEVQKIQIPNTSWTKAQTRFECPSCHKYLNYRELSHCGLCGQRLLWEE